MTAGYVVYDGPSMLDGKPIVVIVCALERSRNVKTGHMVQTYIIRKDMHPVEAVNSGEDASICGTCVHRKDPVTGRRSCYVTLAHGPSHVWRSYQRGVYEVMHPAAAGLILAGRMIRLGTYGDPAAAPLDVWRQLTAMAEGWTGYSHAWRTLTEAWARLVMASVDSIEEMDEAHDRGWRTFRVGGEAVRGAEVVCPASAEAGKKAQCIECRACMGLSAKANVSIQIAPHGAGARYAREREMVNA